jgi:hypothetical protein
MESSTAPDEGRRSVRFTLATLIYQGRSLRFGAALALLLGATSSLALSQCPDGTRCAATRAAPTIDRNRVAIFPLRTTGLDPSQRYLGAGLAELLAAEFNGELGPTAVEPVESHRAWTRAGGDRGPLTRTVALRTARELGAGHLIEGSIVRTGPTFTVTISMLSVADGTTQGTPVRIPASEDSLNTVSAALATQILGTRAGITATVPWEAQRAYLAGMELYRKRAAGADSQFLRAMRIDSTFILPVYRMVLLNAVLGPQILGVGGFRPEYGNLWNRRQQLSPEQRVLLEAVGDSNGLRFTRMMTFLALERAMPTLQNSAEAWEILANGYFHVGPLLGREDWAERSKQAYLRVIGLDSASRARVYSGLADLAFYAGDARGFATYSQKTPSDLYGAAWERYEGALLSRDQAKIRKARTQYARVSAAGFRGRLVSHPFWLTGSHLPPGEVDSLLRQLEPLAISDEQRRHLDILSHEAAVLAGRPARANELARRLGGPGASAAARGMIDVAADDSAFFEMALASVDKASKDYALAACEAGLSRLRRADTTGVAAILAEIDRTPTSASDILLRRPIATAGERELCPPILRAGLASFQRSDASPLLRADSLLRDLWFYRGDKYNYDLALAYGRRGEFAKAASVARRMLRWISTSPVPRRMLHLRHEGRWAALAGDTARAIKAYNEYLMWRYNPEPVLVPQRDSVVAELAALTKRYRSRPKRDR